MAKRTSIRKPRPDERIADLVRLALKDGDERLAQALRAWDRLSRKTQVRLVREISETRGVELRQAYPDVQGMAYGLRTKAGETVDEECITFLVRRKWTDKPSRRGGRARRVRTDVERRRLPAYLWHYTTNPRSGKRLLCAVPTDVESLEDGYPQTLGRGLRMEADDRAAENGTVACAVRVPNDDAPHALTCLHVAAMPSRADGHSASSPRASLRPEDGSSEPRLGAIWWKWSGQLERPPQHSFDAAVIKVKAADITALQEAVRGFRAARVLDAFDEPPLLCRILVPDDAQGVRRETLARRKQVWLDARHIEYFERPPQPILPRVVEVDIMQGSVVPGDSGAAVINHAGDTLLGILLAGVVGQPRGYYMPAYYLFDGSNYGQSGRLSLEPNP